MKINNLFRVLLVLGIAGMFGCGGGGGSDSPAPAPAPAKATTTVSGKVEFPSLSSLVGKRVYIPAVVYVQAYTIDGVKVGSQVTADASGNFVISGLNSGVDYVLKATSGSQVLKKLIEKAAVAPGATVTDQNISGISTTAVIVASNKLAATTGVASLNLGETATLTETQKTALSTGIFSDVSPGDLETAIANAATTVQGAITNGTLSSLSDADLARLVNTLNIVVAAVVSNTDPSLVVNGQIQNFTVATGGDLKLLVISGGVVSQGAAITSVTSTIAQQTVTTSVTAYTPPSRVQLDIATAVASNTMNGITLDITIPAAAIPRLATPSADGLSYALDLSSLSLAAGISTGTIVDAQYTAATRKLRVVIAVGNENSFLQPGKLVSILFDRTTGTTVTAGDFTTNVVNAIDLNGKALLSGFTVTNTVTSSGS